MKSFTAIPAIAVLITVVLAAPSLQTRQDIREINVIVQQIKKTSEGEITAIDKETSRILGHACSNTLNSGAFANFHISADLDDNGAGSIIVGPYRYQVHENPEISGGITCGRIYNSDETFTACNISVPTSLELAPLSKSDSISCFTNGTVPSFQSVANLILTASDPALPEMTNLTAREAACPVEKRQACGFWSGYTNMVGDGNPHQNYYHTQLTENLYCDLNINTCGVGYQQSLSITISWSSSAKAFEWLNGGFDVSKSWTGGTIQTCTANPGDTVCMWHNTAHTAYTVQNYNLNQCTGSQPYGSPFVIFSPNTDNIGGRFYCVVGTCRNKGAAYWDYSGPAGGPQ